MTGTVYSPSDILYYGVDEDFGVFSNFYPAPIMVDGKMWPTTEHFFQAQKFLDNLALQEKIRELTTPDAAAKEGRNRSNPLRGDWESVKDDVMLTALRAKFTQHAQLKEVLLGTGERRIVENAKEDSYWGNGGDGSGRDMMGQLLMKLRSELRQGSKETGTS